MVRPLPSELDFRFSSECPACGNRAGWDGELKELNGRVELGMSCPSCGNRYDELNPQWEAKFRATPRPSFRPGAAA